MVHYDIKIIKTFILFLFLFQSTAFIRPQNADSLIQILEKTESEKRIKLLAELAEITSIKSPAKAFDICDEGLNLSKQYSDKESEIKFYFYKGWAHIQLSNADSAKEYVKIMSNQSKIFDSETGHIYRILLEARILRSESKYDEGVRNLNQLLVSDLLDDYPILKVKILNELGSIHRRLGNNESALTYHQQALEILLRHQNENELVTTYTYLGILYGVVGNYSDALKYYHLALKHNELRNDIRGVAGSIHNIGILYQKIAQYDKSLEYYERALKYWKELDNKGGLASTLNSIGAVKELTGEHKEALNYYQQALDIWEQQGSQSSLTVALNNIASIHEHLGNYKEGLNYISRSIIINEKIGDKNGLSSSLLILATIYNRMGNADSAIYNGKRGLELARATGSWTTIREAHHILANIYETNGLYKEAFYEYKNYKAAHDSMFNTESQEAIAELGAKYESENQKRQIELLQRDKEIQTLYNSALFAGLLGVIIISLLLYNRYRLKHNAHKTLQKLHTIEMESAEAEAKILQIEYDQKKKELDDARQLQLSMLPSSIPVHSKLNISALMLTATEVGGDYYDFCESSDGSIKVVIGDATGHGAQAGTMVTATKSLFNLLSSEDDIADILNRMSFALNKMHLSNMFMALALLKFKNDSLELAGAGMPPALVYRADSEIVESVPLKGLPLGVSNYKYQKVQIKLNPGDAVALMSDGLPELFNEKLEMFGYENLSAILQKSGKETPEKIIQHFTNASEEWLKSNKQQDDMTFVVFKMK